MVHVQQRINNLGGALGQALGTGLGIFAGQKYNDYRQQQYEQKQKANLENALTQAQQVYSNQNLSPEEKTLQLYKALSSNPAAAKSITDQLLEHRKLDQPKAPPGGLTGQPVPQDVGQKISEIVQNNPKIKSDQLAIQFDKAGIPRVFSNSYIENRRRQDESQVNQNIANEKKDADIKRDIEKQNRKEELDFHSESKNYDEELNNHVKSAKGQIETIKNLENALKSGNIKPTSLSNIFKGMGTVGEKISKALLTKDESSLLSSIPNLLEGWKEIFGVRLSDADLKLLEDKLPSLGKTPEANQAVLKTLKKYAEMTLLRGEIANDIKNNNKGLRPLNYANKIEERFDEMIQPVKIIRHDNGNEIEVPAYKLSAFLKKGAKFVPNQNFGTREANE